MPGADVVPRISAKLPGYDLTLQSNTKAEDKYIVAAYNDRTPGARYLYDWKSDSITKLGDINSRIPAAAMAPMKPVQYRSRDGLTINGYLTLPVAREPKNLACIVNPHGGRGSATAGATTPKCSSLPIAVSACCR